MKRDYDKMLDRLFHSASMTTLDGETEMPYGFDNRVIARWNAGEAPVDFSWILPVARRVLSLSVVVMLVIVGLNWQRLNSNSAEEFVVQPYAAAMGLVK